jgi:anti-sigma B factor antagonist
MPSFYITEEVQSDDLIVLAVGGEMDFESSPELRSCIDSHIKAGRAHIMLDLSMASFIDSTAIGVLAACAIKLERSGAGSLAVVCPVENRKILRIFDIAGLENVVTVYRSREDALVDLVAAF